MEDSIFQRATGSSSNIMFVDLKWCCANVEILGHNEFEKMENVASRLGFVASVVMNEEEDQGVKMGQDQKRKQKDNDYRESVTRKKLKKFWRRDIKITDVSDAKQIASSFTKRNDIIGVVPLSEKALLACGNGTIECDIVAMELHKKLPFKLKTNLLQKVVSRGIFFEICYADALRGPLSRRNLISNAKALIEGTRGRGIIISSGARCANELRAPLDIVNLCHLFGFRDNKHARMTVDRNVRECLQRARLKRDAHDNVVEMQVD